MRKSLVTHVTTAVVALTIALPTVSMAVWADEAPPAGAPPAPAAAASDKYTAEELQTLVGPVALYPDVVLSSVMAATTYPDQVTAAGKWLAANAGAKADAAPADWDASIKSLVEVPDVLKWLGENPDWVQQLGYAVSVQQAEVLSAVQEFRKQAQSAGNLKTDEHMSVSGGGTTSEVIVIEPTDPEVIYVPTYEPAAVVSSGYASPYWGWGAGIALGAFGAWAIHEMNWGGHGHGDGSINIDNSRNTNIQGGNRTGPNRPTQFQGKAGGQRPGGAVQRPSTKPGGVGGPGGAGKPGGVGGPGGAGKPGGVGGPGGAGKPGGVGGPGGAGKPGGVGGPGGAGKPGGVGGAGGAGKPGGVGGPGGVSRPGGAAPKVPGMHPGSPGGAGRPGGAGGAGGARPSTPSRNPPNHAFGGAGSGAATQKASNRGSSSMNRSGSSSKAYGGRSGGGGGGRSGGGGSRGGGGGSRGGGGGGRGGGGGGRRR